MRPRLQLSIPILILVATLAATPAGAISYVPMSDGALVDAADAVALGRVTAIHPGPLDGPPTTEYLFELAEVYRGTPAGGTITVRVLGGERPDGLGLALQDAPRFIVGEEVLLFLRQAGEGGFWPLNLGLGVFRTGSVEGRRMAFAAVTAADAAAASGGSARDLARFGEWIAARSAGEAREPDYFVALPEDMRRRALAPFTHLNSGGRPTRWTTFDNNGEVAWRAHTKGQAGLAGGGFTQIAAALAGWNDDPGSRIQMRYAGTTGSTSAFNATDGINSILFDQNLASFGIAAFDCANGGVLAIGGPWTQGTVQHQGTTYARIIEAEVLTNQGTACYYASQAGAAGAPASSPAKRFEQVAGHEIGHADGAGHSCDEDAASEPPSCSSDAVLDDALMRWQQHADNRGARLNADDQAFAAKVYPQPGGSGAPAAPSQLTANGKSTSQIELAWKDNATNETGFEIEARALGGTFAKIGTAAANATSFVVGGLPAQSFRELRVRAINTKGASAYSNVASASTNAAPSACTAPCFQGRFKVVMSYRTSSGSSGSASIASITADTGYGWFFVATNVEVVFKVIDGCGLNNAFWVFLAGLTDVEVVIQVIDTLTGAVKTYINPLGTAFAPIQDTGAFACS